MISFSTNFQNQGITNTCKAQLEIGIPPWARICLDDDSGALFLVTHCNMVRCSHAVPGVSWSLQADVKGITENQ